MFKLFAFRLAKWPHLVFQRPNIGIYVETKLEPKSEVSDKRLKIDYKFHKTTYCRKYVTKHKLTNMKCHTNA